MASNDIFEKESVSSAIIKLAIPTIVSSLVTVIYNLADTYFVGLLNDPVQTAAVTLAAPALLAFNAINNLFGVGTSSAMSRALGRGDSNLVRRCSVFGLYCAFISSVLFSVFTGLFRTPLLGLLGASAKNAAATSEYMRWAVTCGAVPSILNVVFAFLVRSEGSSLHASIGTMSGCILNIILDPIFIFGYLGFPAMGVAGAAIATVCGQISGLFIYIFYYHKKKDSILLQISLKGFSPRIQIIRQLYTVGIPSSIMIALPSILISSLNSMLVRFSSVHVAVLGIYYKLQTFIYLPSGGIVQGMRPIVGFNYGAGEMDRVKKTLDLSLVFTAAIMLVGTLLSLIIPEQLLLMFNANEETLKIGIPALRIISLGFLISSFGVIYSGAFEALGKGLSSLIISLLRQLVIILPLSGLLIPLIGPTGVWITLPIAESIASAISILLIRRTLRKLKHSI